MSKPADTRCLLPETVWQHSSELTLEAVPVQPDLPGWWDLLPLGGTLPKPSKPHLQASLNSQAFIGARC